jgi:peptidyl-prolyl cis-trans isomerase A (cyclophilin A)
MKILLGSVLSILTFSAALLAAEETAAAPAAAKNPVVEIKTSKGVIRAELFADKAPATVANFLKYVEKKHFDKTVFHRVMKNFMIQGGGFSRGESGQLEQKETLPPVKNEASNGLKNDRGTLAMARTAAKDSATCQFFINVVDNNKLNLGDPDAVSTDGYAVFGKVTEGMDVVDAIRAVEVANAEIKARTPGGLQAIPAQNVPKEDVAIESIAVVATPAAKPSASPATEKKPAATGKP